MPKFEWIDGDTISELLDVSTAFCSYCGGPARVPEDVLAVLPKSQRAVVVCQDCTTKVTMEDCALMMAHIMGEVD